jgi:spermidine synthase
MLPRIRFRIGGPRKTPSACAMPETLDPARHVKPFVYESLTTKSLHFSICEIQSRMDLRDPYALDLEYTQTMMGFLLFLPQPQEIAMIGLGGGSLAKFCHRHLPGARIQVVEINPHVIALRERFHVPPDDERFRVIHGDGASYVRDRATRPDVLLVDAFDYDGLPARLSSQRFYDDCHEMLQPGGILVLNLHYGHAQYPRLLDRVRRSFGGAVLVVDDRDLSNSIAFASKRGALEPARGNIARRPRGLNSAASEQLLGAFARVMHALRERDTP